MSDGTIGDLLVNAELQKEFLKKIEKNTRKQCVAIAVPKNKPDKSKVQKAIVTPKKEKPEIKAAIAVPKNKPDKSKVQKAIVIPKPSVNQTVTVRHPGDDPRKPPQELKSKVIYKAKPEAEAIKAGKKQHLPVDINNSAENQEHKQTDKQTDKPGNRYNKNGRAIDEKGRFTSNKSKAVQEEKQKEKSDKSLVAAIGTAIKSGVTKPFKMVGNLLTGPKPDSQIQDAAGTAAGGPIYGALKEIAQTKNDPLFQKIGEGFNKFKESIQEKKAEKQLQKQENKAFKTGQKDKKKSFKLTQKEKRDSLKSGRKSLQGKLVASSDPKQQDVIVNRLVAIRKALEVGQGEDEKRFDLELKEDRKQHKKELKAMKKKGGGFLRKGGIPGTSFNPLDLFNGDGGKRNKGGKGLISKAKNFVGLLTGAATSLVSLPVAAAGSVIAGTTMVGKDAYDIYKNKKEGKKAERKDVGGVTGGLGGAVTGAAGGAIIGSVVPIIGTMIGAIIGGGLGAVGGNLLGNYFGENQDKKENQNNVIRQTALESGENGTPVQAKTATSVEPIPKKYHKVKVGQREMLNYLDNFEKKIQDKKTKTNQHGMTDAHKKASDAYNAGETNRIQKETLKEIKTLNKNIKELSENREIDNLPKNDILRARILESAF